MPDVICSFFTGIGAAAGQSIGMGHVGAGIARTIACAKPSKPRDPSMPDLVVQFRSPKLATPYATYVATDSAAEVYNSSFVVPSSVVDSDDLQVVVADDDGSQPPEVIGEFRLDATQIRTAAEGSSLVVLTDEPHGVEKLELRFSFLPSEPRTATVQHRVDQGIRLFDRLKVAAGEVLVIRSSGSYSVTADGRPISPTGISGYRGFNLRVAPFIEAPHGATIATISSGGRATGAVVGDCLVWVAPHDGWLSFGVNDSDWRNNRGTITFATEVHAPRPVDWVHPGEARSGRCAAPEDIARARRGFERALNDPELQKKMNRDFDEAFRKAMQNAREGKSDDTQPSRAGSTQSWCFRAMEATKRMLPWTYLASAVARYLDQGSSQIQVLGEPVVGCHLDRDDEIQIDLRFAWNSTGGVRVMSSLTSTIAQNGTTQGSVTTSGAVVHINQVLVKFSDALNREMNDRL